MCCYINQILMHVFSARLLDYQLKIVHVLIFLSLFALIKPVNNSLNNIAFCSVHTSLKSHKINTLVITMASTEGTTFCSSCVFTSIRDWNLKKTKHENYYNLYTIKSIITIIEAIDT